MTDNEIIKALECCNRNGSCFQCPYDRASFEHEPDCASVMTADALDLINRQKAEIERLKDLNNVLEIDIINANMNLEHIQTENEKHRNIFDRVFKEVQEAKSLYVKDISRAKAEAVKEFAEIVKANQRMLFNYIYSRNGFVEAIDNLVKEFTEELT